MAVDRECLGNVALDGKVFADRISGNELQKDVVGTVVAVRDISVVVSKDSGRNDDKLIGNREFTCEGKFGKIAIRRVGVVGIRGGSSAKDGIRESDTHSDLVVLIIFGHELEMHIADISYDRAEFEAILDEIVLLLVVSFGTVGEPGSY